MICSPGDVELPDFVLLVAQLHLNVSMSACYDLRQCFDTPVLDNTLASSDELLDQSSCWHPAQESPPHPSVCWVTEALDNNQLNLF